MNAEEARGGGHVTTGMEPPELSPLLQRALLPSPRGSCPLAGQLLRVPAAHGRSLSSRSTGQML